MTKSGLVKRILGISAASTLAMSLGGCVAGEGSETTGQSASQALSTSSQINIGVTNNNVCVDVPNASFVSGNYVQAWTCNGATQQAWTYNSTTLQLTIGGLCLDIPGANFANGQNVQLWSCNGTAAQQWTYSQGMFIAAGSVNANVNAYNHGLCLNAGNLNNGEQLSVWDCWWGDPNNHFTMPNAGTSWTSVVHVGPGTNVCLDSGSGSSPGELVQAWACNGSAAQSWTYNDATGTLMNKGLCLDVPNGNYQNFQTVQLWTCNGTAAQDWRYQGGNFIQLGSGNNSTPYSSYMCLNDPYANTANGTRIAIYPCTMGDVASLFSVPGAWNRTARDCTAAAGETDQNVAAMTGQLCNIWGSAMTGTGTTAYFKAANGDEYNPNIQISHNVDWYIANAGVGTYPNGQTNRNYLLSTYASVNPVYARAVTPAECADITSSAYYNFLTKPTQNGASINTTVVPSDSACDTMLAYDPYITAFYSCGYWC